MTPRFNKFALTAHITFSVGWLGAVIAYLALAIAGLTVHDAQMVRAAYLSMEMIGWFVIVPFSLAALLTGLVQSLGTRWGLFRHYWVLITLVLTTLSTVVLLLHMPTVSSLADVAREADGADLARLGGDLLHPGVGERGRDGGRLDELRAVPDDGEHLQPAAILPARSGR